LVPGGSEGEAVDKYSRLINYVIGKRDGLAARKKPIWASVKGRGTNGKYGCIGRGGRSAERWGNKGSRRRIQQDRETGGSVIKSAR